MQTTPKPALEIIDLDRPVEELKEVDPPSQSNQTLFFTILLKLFLDYLI